MNITRKKLEQILNIIFLVKLLKNDAEIFNLLRQVYEEDGRYIWKNRTRRVQGAYGGLDLFSSWTGCGSWWTFGYLERFVLVLNGVWFLMDIWLPW